MYYILIASIPDKAMKNMSNKALIDIYQDIFLNHQIKSLLKINRKAKIIVVCAFESKKILDHGLKNKRVHYVTHNYNEFSNVGESIKAAIEHIPDNTAIHIINLSMVIDPIIIKNIKSNKSFIIINKSKKFKSKIGCTIDTTNNRVEYLFYDLLNKVCESLYISKEDNSSFKHIVETYVKNNMYLFEIINLLIDNKMHINTVVTNSNILHFHSPEQLIGIKYLFKKMSNNNVNSI